MPEKKVLQRKNVEAFQDFQHFIKLKGFLYQISDHDILFHNFYITLNFKMKFFSEVHFIRNPNEDKKKLLRSFTNVENSDIPYTRT